MSDKTLKISLGCRIDPATKQIIDEEAKAKNLTTSFYLTQIIENREKPVVEKKKQVSISKMEGLNIAEKINLLKTRSKKLQDKLLTN